MLNMHKANQKDQFIKHVEKSSTLTRRNVMSFACSDFLPPLNPCPICFTKLKAVCYASVLKVNLWYPPKLKNLLTGR